MKIDADDLLKWAMDHQEWRLPGILERYRSCRESEAEHKRELLSREADCNQKTGCEI